MYIMKNWELTTECGYKWRWDQMHYWKGFYKARPLIEDKTGKQFGVAFGPVMFFWDHV